MADLIICERNDLVNIANAIRTHTGKTDGIILGDMVSEINKAIELKEPTLQSKTVSPSTSSQTVKPDTGYDGLSQVTVNGDANLVAENIKKDVTIFGKTGTYEGEGGSTVEMGAFILKFTNGNITARPFEIGMTWAEFCDSPYNSDNLLFIYNGDVQHGAGYSLSQSSSALIENKKTYSTIFVGGGGSD